MLALTNSFAKSLSVRIHPFQTVFLQSALATLIFLPFALKEGGVRGLIPRHKGLHLLRDVSGCLAFAFSFCATLSIPIVDAMLLYSANVLWIPIILFFVFKQKVPFKLLVCILLGFVGVALILKPASSLFTAGSLWGVASGLCMAVAMICLRILAQNEPRHRIVFFVCFVSSLIGAFSLPFVWVTPTFYEMGFVVANAFFMVITQIMLTVAYKLAPASRLSPFSYSVVISAGFIDWLIWGIFPTPLSLVGAVLVVGAALASVWLKTKRSLT